MIQFQKNYDIIKHYVYTIIQQFLFFWEKTKKSNSRKYINYFNFSCIKNKIKKTLNIRLHHHVYYHIILQKYVLNTESIKIN